MHIMFEFSCCSCFVFSLSLKYGVPYATFVLNFSWFCFVLFGLFRFVLVFCCKLLVMIIISEGVFFMININDKYIMHEISTSK
ncbi:hypothetical protein DFH27DRAFT_576645 [Peziza echinospora]|nr:hypothetical protein DFH27DRAFT_576645 [Peziza echinospora]